MNRLGLFLFSDSENTVDDYIYYLLDDLTQNTSQLCVIVNDNQCKKFFKRYTDDIIVNSKFDTNIEIWKDVLINHFTFDELEKFDEIVLFDNSFFGPIYPFEEIFTEMDDVKLDFWTILNGDNNEKSYSCSSHSCNFQFIVFRNSLIKTADFKKYWMNINEFDVKNLNYETVFIDYFTNLGYNWNNYLNINNKFSENETNNFVFNIYDLVVQSKLPLINIKPFTLSKKMHLDYNLGLDLSLTMNYLNQDTDYDVSLIYNYLLRVIDANVLVNSLNLRKIIPKDNINKNYKSAKKIVVICHIYFTDLLDYTFNYLKNIPDYIDVVITTDSKDKQDYIEKNLSYSLKNKSQVILVNPRGRDMAGLFVGCKNIINKYDYFCFMHDKKSAGNDHITVESSFRDNIWENMLASEDYINSIVKDFDENYNLGLIVPPSIYHGTYFNAYSHKYWIVDGGLVKDYDLSEELLEKMDINVIISKNDPPLSIGNCFWAKVDALKPLFDLDWDYDDFPPEPMPGDGTVSHALERIYGYVAASQRYYTKFVMTEEYGGSELTNFQYMFIETLQVLMDNFNELSKSNSAYNSFLNKLAHDLNQFNKSQRIINEKNKEINILKNSTSWKVTKPLRKVSSLIKGNVTKEKNINLEDLYFVSVIMPTYNRKNFIAESINSVLNQTFKNFELLIVDDGSDDGTEEFIKESYHDLDNIKYLKIDHKGVSTARNYALKKSEGNIIAYLDSDNQWDSKFLETMLKNLKDFDCAYCGVNIDNKIDDTTFTLNSEFNRKNLLIENFIDINSFIHKKTLYEDFGGFDEDLKRLVDWDLIIRYTKNKPPVHVKTVLVNYILDDSYSTITNSVPLDEYMDKIHEKYWMELYFEEYNIIKNDFDETFYVNEYGDEFSDILTPIHHFLSIGFKEGKNPNKEFNTLYYRNQHKKLVENEEINPFVYYIQNGRKDQKVNYCPEVNKILNTNRSLLSNYEFEHEPLVSIIISNEDGFHHLKSLFNDFADKANYSNFEIIVVDNASEDKSVEYLKNLEMDINIIENQDNVSFAKGNNDAVKIANGEYVLLLNSNIEPTYGWLNEMMGTMIYNDNVASVGAKLIYPYIEDYKNSNKSFTIQNAGDILRESLDDVCIYKAHNQNKFSKNIFDSDISVNKKRLLVSDDALLVKKTIYEKLDGLDENYSCGYECVDFNLRVNKAGYDTMFASSALLFHHGSVADKIDQNNYKIFSQKWDKYLFKKLLQDKIEKNYFFTDKKLEFLIISENNDYIDNLSKFCIQNEFNMTVTDNLKDVEISTDVDVIVFTDKCDLTDIKVRGNVIKILILEEGFEDADASFYDILISKSQSSKDSIVLDDFNNLGEDLISILYKEYLN